MSLKTDIAADMASDHVYFDVVGGHAVTATLADSSNIPVRFMNEPGVFDGGETRASITTPRAYCRASEAPSVNDTVTVDSISYRVTHRESDTIGRSLLHLERL